MSAIQAGTAGGLNPHWQGRAPRRRAADHKSLLLSPSSEMVSSAQIWVMITRCGMEPRREVAYISRQGEEEEGETATSLLVNQRGRWDPPRRHCRGFPGSRSAECCRGRMADLGVEEAELRRLEEEGGRAEPCAANLPSQVLMESLPERLTLLITHLTGERRRRRALVGTDPVTRRYLHAQQSHHTLKAVYTERYRTSFTSPYPNGTNHNIREKGRTHIWAVDTMETIPRSPPYTAVPPRRHPHAPQSGWHCPGVLWPIFIRGIAALKGCHQ